MEMIEGDTAEFYKINPLYDYFELKIAPSKSKQIKTIITQRKLT
jgi:hypothetical protein